jgi:hypothetical protein
MLAGTFTEATYTGYARATIASSLTNWAGTQGAGTVAASSGTSGATSNNVALSFGSPTSAQSGLIVGAFLADAATAGNILIAGLNATPLALASGATAPNFPAATIAFNWA